MVVAVLVAPFFVGVVNTISLFWEELETKSRHPIQI